MKYIALLKTYDHEHELETDSFDEAWGFLHQHSKNITGIVQASVLENVRWSDGHYMYPNKEIASMRVVQ